jgi:hypothetical protein
MSNRFIQDQYETKLARVYVALQMSKNVAETCAADQPSHVSQALLTLLEVTSHLLEDVIAPEPQFNLPAPTTFSEAVM